MFSHLRTGFYRHSQVHPNRIKGDWRLLFIPVLLTLFGLLMIFEVSSVMAIEAFGNRLYFFERQVQWFIISLIAFLIVSQIDHNYFKRFAIIIFASNIFLLILVLIPSIGVEILGGRRWLDFGLFNFQPSELMKISLSIYLASLLTKPSNKYVVGLVVAVVSGLLILEPDMGTMLIMVGIAGIIYFISGVTKKVILGSIGVGLLAILILIVVSPYRLARLNTYLNPQFDNVESSYHLKQILIALGNGGISGQGLGMSKQKYLYIPEVTTDSIFAIVGEEFGFTGVVGTIIVYVYYLYICFSYLLKHKEKYASLLGVGLVSSIALPFFINIGAISALVPLTGIPLPFISYGGTALTINFICAGIIYNISKSVA